MFWVKLISIQEAKAVSKIKNKHLENHLFMRLEEYQINLVKQLVNPEKYGWSTKKIRKDIKAVYNQLQGRNMYE